MLIAHPGAYTYLWFTQTFGSNIQNSCFIQYEVYTSTLILADDSGNLGPLQGYVPSSQTLSNSQCTVNLNTAPSNIGNTSTLILGVSFKSNYTGQQTIYLDLWDNGTDLYWPPGGTWTIQ